MISFANETHKKNYSPLSKALSTLASLKALIDFSSIFSTPSACTAVGLGCLPIVTAQTLLSEGSKPLPPQNSWVTAAALAYYHPPQAGKDLPRNTLMDQRYPTSLPAKWQPFFPLIIKENYPDIFAPCLLLC